MNDSQIVWIHPQDEMPDVCVTCGLWADRRVQVTYRVTKTRMVEAKESSSLPVVLGCFALFLGPFGLIFHLMQASKRDEPTQLVRKQKIEKGKLKVSQCPLCQGDHRAKAVDNDGNGVALLAHSRFIEEFERLREMARDI